MRRPIVPRLDAWIAGLFDADNLDATCEALAMAAWSSDDDGEAGSKAARRKLADCDQRLAKYRQALDAGADAAVVAGWMAEVQGERLVAETELGRGRSREAKLTKERRRATRQELGDIAAVLADGRPEVTRREVYEELGVSVRLRPDRRRRTAGVRVQQVSVGGGT